ncbi:MAG: dephospho-CoA kinase [Chloroflexi bacterium]|nr:dephospho-CoA kinase [Chloroflexota bacterium]
MKLLGLTGGIGMGKSTAAEILQRHGAAIADTDLIARQMVEPGQPAWRDIQEIFGGEIVDDQGRLRRGELARIIFGNPAARRQLEEILHPRIQAAWLAEVASWRKAGLRRGAVVIPLLFETGAAGHFDATVCVACSATTQRDRLKRRGWTEEEILQRIQAQWPTEKKMASADFVIWTESGLEVHAAQMERVLLSL